MRAGTRAARTPRRRRRADGLPPRGILLRNGYLSRIPGPERIVEVRGSAVEEVGMSAAGIWQDRPALVTGATGLVGSWLTRRLVESGADVVCLLRDWVPQSEAVRSGTLDRVKVVRGDVC